MRSITSLSAALPALLLLSETVFGAGFDCSHARDDGVKWDLSELKGRHTVSWAHEHAKGTTITNTTFLVDICDNLKKDNEMLCSHGTHVCAMDQQIDNEGKKLGAPNPTDIAGEYTLNSGAKLDHEWKRLKSSDSNSDAEKHGVRLKMGGGKSDDGQKQVAFIEFICLEKDKRAEGVNTLVARDDDEDDDDDDDDEKDGDTDGDDDDDGDHHSGGSHDELDKTHPEWAKLRESDDGKGGTIKFVSYKVQSNLKTLRLEWNTPYACEGADKDPDLHDDSGSGGWGFFSWFFFLAFMGILAYFAFFAWINYSRHGATGWDMLPHADTIRDIPYILGDWARKVVGTVRGGSSRGGYSAL